MQEQKTKKHPMSVETVLTGLKFAALIPATVLEKTVFLASSAVSFAIAGAIPYGFISGQIYFTGHTGPGIVLLPVIVGGGIYGGFKMLGKTFSKEGKITEKMIDAKDDWIDARRQLRGLPDLSRYRSY